MPNPCLRQRCAGVLLHPTSLPSATAPNGALGALGSQALLFIDWLQDAGIRCWQMLPLGPTQDDLSPYASYSAFAGNPALLDHAYIAEQLLGMPLPESLTGASDRIAWFSQTIRKQEGNVSAAFQRYCQQQAHWLDDYALYSAIKVLHQHQHWCAWPLPLKERHSLALQAFCAEYAEHITHLKTEQFLFDWQWQQVRAHAHRAGIRLIGDIPIFVAHDSADVWAHPTIFQLRPDGQPRVVAGVPPDYFSETGQRWGNPHYDWQVMARDGYAWWRRRLSHCLSQFDQVRIDHFRGFDACWEIPADEQTAIMGRWVDGPGLDFFQQVFADLSDEAALPLIAEDLGIITPRVDALRKALAIPGMKILQFAFGDTGSNPYLPHNHVRNCVLYTGTHDNDTTLGWYQSLSPDKQEQVMQYLAWPQEAMPWPLIKAALGSVANLAIIPMQDILALDTHHRMNIPGTASGNWRWQFQWQQVPPELAGYLKRLMGLYMR